MTDTNDTAKLWDMIKTIEIAMMVTEDGDHLRSRPMAVSQKEFDGKLWFFTRASSHKVTEVEQDHRVNLAYAASWKAGLRVGVWLSQVEPRSRRYRPALV